MPMFRIIWEIDEEAPDALTAVRQVARRMTPYDDVYTAIEHKDGFPVGDAVPILIDLQQEGMA